MRGLGEGLHIFDGGGGFDRVHGLFLNAERKVEPAMRVIAVLHGVVQAAARDGAEHMVEQFGLAHQRMRAVHGIFYRIGETVGGGAEVGQDFFMLREMGTQRGFMRGDQIGNAVPPGVRTRRPRRGRGFVCHGKSIG